MNIHALRRMAESPKASRGGGRSESIISVIVKTLELLVRFPVQAGRIIAPEPYRSFAHVVRNVAAVANKAACLPFTFITFNYDVALDYALHELSLPFHYWLSEGSGNRYPYLKLHGSINWGECPGCRRLIARQFGELQGPPLFEDTTYATFAIGSTLDQTKHCGPLTVPPALVPPTWNKGSYHDDIRRVWRKAAEALGNAENIVIIGYSLPETDLFFRYLFALGTDSPRRIKSLWVINPDPDGEVEKRFRRIIGREIESRVKFFKGNDGLFEENISRLQGELKSDYTS